MADMSKTAPRIIHVVTRAKKNCTAYEQPGGYKGRGRRPLRGAVVHIWKLFISKAEAFQEAELPIYGAKRHISCLSCVYLWGQKLYQPLQFVLVKDGGKQLILVSTDLDMSARDIITDYAYWFKIEAMFREFKLQFGGLFYHFWTKAVPKLNRYRKNSSPDPLL